jgi:hypothetical protein
MYMKKLLTFGTAAILSAAPLLAAAQTPTPAQGNLGNVTALIVSLGRIFNLLIPIFIVLAILAFFWGLIKYIQGGKGLSEGRSIMIAGLVSLFIMVSLWGILGFIGNAIGINNAGGNIPSPQVPIQ